MNRACTFIVAGGQGRRIGGDKADTQLCGVRLIDHVIERAKFWDLPIFIQVRSPDQVSTPDYPQVLDKPAIEGPLSGIIAGLEYAQKKDYTHILTVACDMPFLPKDLLDWLLPAAIGADKIAVAQSDGQIHPICAVWPVKALPTLKDCSANGQISLKGASRVYGREALDWPVTLYDPFFNINTAADLERAQSILQSQTRISQALPV